VTERGWAWIALALYLAWGILAFGLRTIVQIRRTGDSGFRGAGGPPASAEWWARVVFTTAILVGVAAPIAALLGVAPFAVLDHAGLRITGGVMAFAGLVATLWAQMAMGDAWRIGVDTTERTELVLSGPFRFVRNPIFTAMGVTAVGLALLVPNWLSLVGIALLVLGVELQVRRVEEPHLLSMHGAAYARYAGRAGRFIPLVGRGLGRRRHRGNAATTP
jgi:protein-S-isoprenylcysteine O-methyltransferase Ste14